MGIGEWLAAAPRRHGLHEVTIGGGAFTEGETWSVIEINGELRFPDPLLCRTARRLAGSPLAFWRGWARRDQLLRSWLTVPDPFTAALAEVERRPGNPDLRAELRAEITRREEQA